MGLQPAAVLTVISGEVSTRFGAGDFSSAVDGAVLYVGSGVRTGADARAVITLFEGSTVELEPASDLTIEEATTHGASTIVQLAQSLGRSWHVVTHLTTADSRYEDGSRRAARSGGPRSSSDRPTDRPTTQDYHEGGATAGVSDQGGVVSADKPAGKRTARRMDQIGHRRRCGSSPCRESGLDRRRSARRGKTG